MSEKSAKISNLARIHPSAKIEANELIIEDCAIIEDNVHINAKKVNIGYGTKIEKGAAIKSIGGQAKEVIIGDFSLIGFETRVLTPVFKMGDYCTLHNHCLVLGYKPCVMGHNNWIGEYTILNSTEKLTIGNNVGIGTSSRIWTHVSHGELLEGCVMHGATPVAIEDSVWIVGGAIVSPGLTLARRSTIMTGAVLTKSTEPEHVYAGIPARDITNKLTVYKQVTLADKIAKIKEFIAEFVAANPWADGCIKLINYPANISSNPCSQLPILLIFSQGEVFDLGKSVSAFSLETKHYTKKRTLLEHKFMKFLINYRAKFTPL